MATDNIPNQTEQAINATEPLAWTDQASGYDVSVHLSNIKKLTDIGGCVDDELAAAADLSALMFAIQLNVNVIENILGNGSAS